MTKPNILHCSPDLELRLCRCHAYTTDVFLPPAFLPTQGGCRLENEGRHSLVEAQEEKDATFFLSDTARAVLSQE